MAECVEFGPEATAEALGIETTGNRGTVYICVCTYACNNNNNNNIINNTATTVSELNFRVCTVDSL